MNATIYPSHFISENFNIIGSKSLAHRYIIGAFLLNNAVIIDNVPNNDDINATLDFFTSLGKEIIYPTTDSLYIKESKIIKKDILEVNVKGSASTLRFLLPLALNFASKVIFNCDESLINRPLSVYEDLATNLNVSININKEKRQIICSGSFSADYYAINASISSQFVTGLIINALYLNKATTIELTNEVASFSYIKMSVEVFKELGFNIDIIDNKYIYVHNYYTKKWDEYKIEGDYSIAANYLVLAALNGSLTTNSLNINSLQGDIKIISLLKDIGANIYFTNDNLKILNNSLLTKGKRKQLNSFNFDLNDNIDLGPILMVLASFCLGTSTISNVDRLKIKESNRLEIMLTSLAKLGVDIKYLNNKIIIKGKKDYFNQKVTLDCAYDHRIAMALTIFSLLNNGMIILTNIECVNKSYPNFFNNLINYIKNGAISFY